jgi:hypothetical protein
MAHPSYKEFYKAVKRFPKELKIALQEIAGTNQKRIFELLLDKPKETIVGEYYRKDRNVHLQEMQVWELSSKLCLVNTVPYLSVSSAINALNSFLKRKGLPYSVWFKCQIGHPHHRSGKRIRREKTDFKIGLVDKRQPKTKKPPA